MKEVYKNIYMEEFPLTGNPLKSINIFVIKSDDLNMIVDTGFDNEEVKECMLKLIDDLELDLSKTILFLTHLHSDHVGLASFLEKKGIKEILISGLDGHIIDTGITVEGEQWQRTMRVAKKQGLEEDMLDIFKHPGYVHRPKNYFKYTKLKVGDRIDIGDFHFVTIDEAGHTPGMMGLYEADKKILFCGDHILGRITPNITYWGEEFGDMLGTYIRNLEKIKDYGIKYLFSSHRFLVEDVNKRIDELVAHHKHRLNETREILREGGPMTARDVATKMKWSIKAKGWDDFPPTQKWFASGEATSHLVYLRERGEVKETIQDNGVAIYTVVDK